MTENIENKIGTATVWSSLSEILAKLISPVVNMVLARILTPEAFGVVATITMVTSFADIFTDAGFQKYIIQHEFSSSDELNKNTTVAFWTNLSVSAVIVLIIFVFRNSIASLVGSPNLGNSISVASLVILMTSFSSIQNARFKRVFDFKTLFFVRMGLTLIPLAVTLPLAFFLRNYWALIIGTLISNIFMAVVLTIKSEWKPSFYYSFKELKSMLSFSLWTLLETISIWLSSYIGVFLVGRYLNEYYLGLYKTSITVVNSCMAIIASAFTPVLFSALSRYQNDEKNFWKTYLKFQRLTSVLVFPLGLGIYLFRDLFTMIILGSQWTEASNFVGLCGIAYSFTIVLGNYNSEVFRSKGKPKQSLFLQISYLVCLVPTIIISVQYGFETLCISKALVTIQIVVAGLLMLKILYKQKISKILKNVLPTFSCSIIMFIFGYVLKGLHQGTVYQLLIIFLCIVVYFAALFVLFPNIRGEVLEMRFVRKITNIVKRR